MSIRPHRVQVHLFDGYWEDIGTIRSFYEANLALADLNPPFDFTAEQSPIYTHARFLPPTRAEDVTIRRSLIADGCMIDRGAVIENSVIGLRCRIGKDVTIRNSVLMGADTYDGTDDETRTALAIGIGDGATIDGAIIDKNCRIGRNVSIQLSESAEPNTDHGEVFVRDGVIVVSKGAALSDGWSL